MSEQTKNTPDDLTETTESEIELQETELDRVSGGVKTEPWK